MLDENLSLENEKRNIIEQSILSRPEIPSIPDENWTTIIKPTTGWFDIHLKELWQYRDLIKLFVYRDFVVYYKQTILGPLWWIIQPLFMSGMFTLVFGTIAKIPTDEIPPILFYLSGVIIWNYFADCFTKTSKTFVQNAGIFGKVYFPRLVMPIAVVISDLLKVIIQIVLFIIIYLIFFFKGSDISINWVILTIPLLILQTAILGLSFGIIVSAVTTKYRDLSLAVDFFSRLWMYATPVVYPLSLLPAKWRTLYLLNPMTSIIETFRLGSLGVGTVTGLSAGCSILITFIVLIIGIILFSKVEKDFMDTV